MSIPGMFHLEREREKKKDVLTEFFFFLVAFNDIGKSAKDLLSKDYPVGGVKLEVKTAAPNGVVSSLTVTLTNSNLFFFVFFLLKTDFQGQRST